MKETSKWFWWAVAGLVAACGWLSGCATGPERPPGKLEARLFVVETNYVPTLALHTNVTSATNRVLGEPSAAAEAASNWVAVVSWSTNVVVSTNFVPAYTFRPGAGAQVITEGGRVAGDLFGVGGLVGTALGGVFGLWAALRSSRTRKTAEVLAQVIETGRAVLESTAQGQELQARWRAWMIEHQAHAGVIGEVKRLLDTAVDADSARGVARRLRVDG